MRWLRKRYRPMDELVRFHRAFGQTQYWTQNETQKSNTLYLRRRLIAEEAIEVQDAINDLHLVPSNQNLEHVAKELADLLVVTYGTAEVLGIPIEDVFHEVMRSNMSKVGPDGKVLRRDDGKILKPPTYVEADVHGVMTGEWL